jgi:hypothetical protein
VVRRLYSRLSPDVTVEHIWGDFCARSLSHEILIAFSRVSPALLAVFSVLHAIIIPTSEEKVC